MRDERPLPGPEVSNEMHDGGRCYVPHSPDFGQMLQECQSPGLRLVEEVRHVLLSLTWDIDSVLVSFTGDINHVSSDSSDLKHLTGTDHSLVRPQLTEPQSQQNWRSEDQDELHHFDCHDMTSSWLTATCQSRPITMRIELCSVRGESLQRVNLWVSYHNSC